MKTITYFILLSLITFSFFNCSDDNSEEDVLIGKWNLVEYNVGIAVDLNDDGIESFNLIDEIECAFNESLSIDNEAHWESTIEHNLQILAINNGLTNQIELHIECDEGIISGIGQLSSEARAYYLVEGTKLTRNFTDAITVYNEDSSAVVGSLSITKIYQKQ